MTVKITDEMIPAVRECLNQLVSEYVREDVTFPTIRKERDGIFTTSTHRMTRNMGVFGVTMRHYYVRASLHPVDDRIEDAGFYHTAYAIAIDLSWVHRSGGCNGQDVFRSRSRSHASTGRFSRTL